MIYVDDCDAIFKQAIDAGGTEKKALQDQFYGDRSGTLEDPFGHIWTVATHKEDVTPEEIDKRLAAMAAAGGGGQRGSCRTAVYASTCTDSGAHLSSAVLEVTSRRRRSRKRRSLSLLTRPRAVRSSRLLRDSNQVVAACRHARHARGDSLRAHPTLQVRRSTSIAGCGPSAIPIATARFSATIGDGSSSWSRS